MRKKYLFFLVAINSVIINLNAQSELVLQRDTSNKSLNKTIIRTLNKEEVEKNPMLPINTDGSNNPEDYGYEKIYINGTMYYYKRDNNMTILFEPKN